jgi:hypothetical protein
MKIKCFGCDAEIEAENLEALADAFVKHGRGNHSWQYPESAVRTYACNYAEAVVRLAGDTVRKKRDW